jgi:hypothetical protein
MTAGQEWRVPPAELFFQLNDRDVTKHEVFFVPQQWLV